jgi:hypothetical protein
VGVGDPGVLRCGVHGDQRSRRRRSTSDGLGLPSQVTSEVML